MADEPKESKTIGAKVEAWAETMVVDAEKQQTEGAKARAALHDDIQNIMKKMTPKEKAEFGKALRKEFSEGREVTGHHKPLETPVVAKTPEAKAPPPLEGFSCIYLDLRTWEAVTKP